MKNVTVILTVHNKARLLPAVWRGLLFNADIQDGIDHLAKIIVVLDGCTDNSESVLQECLKYTFEEPMVEIIKTPDVFEIKANNTALKQVATDYACIIQDDQVMKERGYLNRLLEPFERFPEVIAVTGRAAHNITIQADGHSLAYPDLQGWDNRAPRNIFYIRDVVNRGPLVLDMAKLKAMGYMDEWFCPTSQDDHDLCLRAYRQHGWLAGSYWINYESPPEWGTSRIGKNVDFIGRVINQNMVKIFERHGEFLKGPKHTENRIMA